MKDHTLKRFWGETLKPLFDGECLEFTVQTASREPARYVNLDNAATTPPFVEVRKAVERFLHGYGSVHRGAGQKSKESTSAFDAARRRIREFVRASERNYVVFAQNTTGAINHLAALFSGIPGKVLVSDIEHSSNFLPWLRSGEISLYRTEPSGKPDLEDVRRKLEGGNFKLVAITGASNVTGYRPAIHEIARLAHGHGARIFVDACQLIQHQRVDLKPDEDLAHLDFVAFSGHKMYAPYGAGVLVGPKEFFDGMPIYQIGGGNLPYITKEMEFIRYSTERAHDPGTPNAVGVIAMVKAMEVMESIGYDNILEYEHAIASRIFGELGKIEGVILHVKRKNLGSTIPFDVEGLDPRLVAEILAEEHGIGVRAGTFCCYELIRRIKNIPDAQDAEIAAEVRDGRLKGLPGLVRASMGLQNSPDDCERLAQALRRIAKNRKNYEKKYAQDQRTGIWRLKR